MNLVSSILELAHVAIDVDASDKKALFERAGALLESKSQLSRAQVTESLLARERLGSTGLGQAVAIPHGRVKGLRTAIGAFLRLRAPIPFEAPDNQPVQLVFVLLVPERASDLHLQILSELAQMFSDRELRRRLAAAPDAACAQRLILEWQTQLPKM